MEPTGEADDDSPTFSAPPSKLAQPDISIIVITSPSPSNPSTDLISTAISSCDRIKGLENAPVIIIMDGFKVCAEDRFKKGRISETSAIKYELYLEALLEEYEYASTRYSVVRCKEHQGFAHAVKFGLELCNTKYALIAQHDRFFDTTFTRLPELLQAMEEHEFIRYIGFPTRSNINHNKVISTNCQLYCLNSQAVKYDLGENLYLQPAIFWYDSQHLCHVQRYLQIYKPFKNMPAHLKEILGLKNMKDMILRRGDFIEDRFGQMQRRLLCELAQQQQPGRKDDSSMLLGEVEAEVEVEEEGEDDDEEEEEEEEEGKVTPPTGTQSSERLLHAESGITSHEGSEKEEHSISPPKASSTTSLSPSSAPQQLRQMSSEASGSSYHGQEKEEEEEGGGGGGGGGGKNADPIIGMQKKQMNEDLILELFRWYGSYLCWQSSNSMPYDVRSLQECNDTVPMVQHLKGRQSDNECVRKRLLLNQQRHEEELEKQRVREELRQAELQAQLDRIRLRQQKEEQLRLQQEEEEEDEEEEEQQQQQQQQQEIVEIKSDKRRHQPRGQRRSSSSSSSSSSSYTNTPTASANALGRGGVKTDPSLAAKSLAIPFIPAPALDPTAPTAPALGTASMLLADSSPASEHGVISRGVSLDALPIKLPLNRCATTTSTFSTSTNTGTGFSSKSARYSSSVPHSPFSFTSTTAVRRGGEKEEGDVSENLSGYEEEGDEEDSEKALPARRKDDNRFDEKEGDIKESIAGSASKQNEPVASILSSTSPRLSLSPPLHFGHHHSNPNSNSSNTNITPSSTGSRSSRPPHQHHQQHQHHHHHHPRLSSSPVQPPSLQSQQQAQLALLSRLYTRANRHHHRPPSPSPSPSLSQSQSQSQSQPTHHYDCSSNGNTIASSPGASMSASAASITQASTNYSDSQFEMSDCLSDVEPITMGEESAYSTESEGGEEEEEEEKDKSFCSSSYTGLDTEFGEDGDDDDDDDTSSRVSRSPVCLESLVRGYHDGHALLDAAVGTTTTTTTTTTTIVSTIPFSSPSSHD